MATHVASHAASLLTSHFASHVASHVASLFPHILSVGFLFFLGISSLLPSFLPARPPARTRTHTHTLISCLSHGSSSPSRVVALAVYVSLRDGGSGGVSEPHVLVVLRFGCSADISLQDGGSGGISEPQRSHAVGRGIIDSARCAVFSALRRRLPQVCRPWRYVQAPERPRSRV